MNEIEVLYRTYAPRVLRYAWGLCGDRSTAEDLVSETFVRLLLRAPKVETRTALGYLLVIARNLYLNGLRRRRREMPLSEELRSPELDPGERLDAELRLADVGRVLRAMPEGERSALLLRVELELPYEEIAAVLGITVGAAVAFAALGGAIALTFLRSGPGRPRGRPGQGIQGYLPPTSKRSNAAKVRLSRSSPVRSSNSRLLWNW